MSYSNLAWTAVIAAFAVSIGAAPAAAKGGNAKAKQPTVRVTAKAKPVKAAKAGPSTTAGAKAKAPKVKAASGSGAAKSTKTAKASGSRSATPTLSSGTPATPTTGSNPTQSTDRDPRPTGTPVTTDRLNKAQQLLMKNDNLRMKMQARLGGMDPILAASDFRNLGQFVAAVNASYNDPSIQFLALKALMTGDPPMSLGQAKQQLRGVAPPVASTIPTVTGAADQR